MSKETEVASVKHDEVSQDSHSGAELLADRPEYKRLLRKVDWHVMPVLCTTYALQYYDKALLSQAAIFGLREDLNLQDGLRYSWASLIFYFGYMAGCYPCSLLAQKFPTNRVCCSICIAWAAVVLTTPACTSYHGFLVNRFFLGLIESGVSPTFMLVVGLWYTQPEQVLRSGLWYSFSGGSNLISPLINYGLGHITGGALRPWQYMYLIAGIVTLVWGIALWWLFPGTPEHARGFTAEERVMLLERVRGNNAGAENKTFKVYQAKEAFLQYQFWAIFVLSILTTMGSGAVTTFASIVFRGMGFSTFESLLLNLPIGALAFICVLGSGYLGRKLPRARLHVLAGACLPVIAGCALVWKLPTSARAGRIVGYYLINFFSSAWVQCIGLGTSNAAGHTKKAVYAAGTFVGYSLGNIIGPLLFDAKYAPRYDRSFTGMLVCFAIAAILAEQLRLHLRKINKNRDEKYGPPNTDNGLADFTDKENKSFRYQI